VKNESQWAQEVIPWPLIQRSRKGGKYMKIRKIKIIINIIKIVTAATIKLHPNLIWADSTRTSALQLSTVDL
jgi:hypothetical protein